MFCFLLNKVLGLLFDKLYPQRGLAHRKSFHLFQLAGCVIDFVTGEVIGVLTHGKHEIAGGIDLKKPRCFFCGLMALCGEGAVFIDGEDGDAVVPTVGGIEKMAIVCHANFRG